MAKGILMPKTGITVEECVITEWVKQEGDYVKKGDVLFTYETDKSTFECESTEEGILLKKFYNEGDDVPVLVNVCAIGAEGEETESLRNSEPGEAPAEKTEEKTEEKITEKQQVPEEKTVADVQDRMKISPRARQTARKLDVQPELAAPTGADGRIISRDIYAYAQSRPGNGFGGMLNGTESEVAPSKEKEIKEERKSVYTDVKFSGVRKATARTMMKSLSTMAQLTHFHTFDATEIMNYRKRIKENGEKMGLPNITLNDMVLFAVSRVLEHHKTLNSLIVEENVLRTYEDVHLGMAVNTPQGLFVPTIFEANKKSLAEIAEESKQLARACKEGKVTPNMLSGASFTVSNVGSLGVEMFTPVVNPPQVGILGVCSMTQRVKEVNGEMKIYPAMGLALSYDHRALDGTPASMFVKELCSALENFDLLLLK